MIMKPDKLDKVSLGNGTLNEEWLVVQNDNKIYLVQKDFKNA